MTRRPDGGLVSRDPTNSVELLTVRIRRAVELTGISRSKLYELIKAGEIETMKVGATTLIPFASLRDFMERQRSRTSGS